MSRKDRNLLVFASMGAIALSILTLVSEGGRIKAEVVEEKQCASIFFGTARYGSSSALSTGDYTVTTDYGFSPTLGTVESCYSAGVSSGAARIGSQKATGSFTMSFSSCVITKVQITGFSFYTDYPGAGTFTTNNGSTQIGTGSFSVSTGDALTTTIDAAGTAEDSSVATVTGLDGGNYSRCTSFTLASVMDSNTTTRCDQISLCKIVLTIVASHSESGSSSSSSSPTSKTLSGIAITTNPTKTTYTAGETLNNDGLVVIASYSDDTSLDITDDVDTTYTPGLGTALTVDNTSVGISYTYGGVTKTASYTITVSAATKTLSGIAITGTATTTSYTAGQSFNSSGLTVTATYSDASTENVTSSVTWTPSPLTSGTTAVTASYTYLAVTKTASYSGITVEAASGSGAELMIRFKEILSGQYCDSIYIKYGNWDCLVDGGNSADSDTVASSLSTYCTDHKLDLYIGTHAHTDHIGVFADATTASNVFTQGGITSFGYIIDSGGSTSAGSTAWTNYKTVRNNLVSNSKVTYVPAYSMFNSETGYTSYLNQRYLNITSSGGTLSSSASGDVYLTFLNHSGLIGVDETASDANTTSVACCLTAFNIRFIFCGDLDSNEESSVVSNAPSGLISASNDVYLKANHHGSSTSNCADWISWAQPDHVLISSAILSTNRTSSGIITTSKQHPYVDAIARFEAATYNIYWTGTNGTFSYTTDDDGNTMNYSGSATSIHYYYNGSIVTGEESTTLPMTKWALSDKYSSIAKTSATGHDSRKIDSPWASPLGSFINLNVDYEALSKLEVKHPDVNEYGELYDAETDSYC